jgi:amino acid transporter
MTTSTVQRHPSADSDDRSGLKRHIGPVGLLFSGVGSIIGSGWLFGAFYAAQKAGPMAIVSWFLGAVMILAIGLVYAELGAMFPVSGGVVRYPHWAFGSFASFSMGWVTWLAAATVAPIEVEGALQYATHYAHGLTTTSGGTKVLTWPEGYLVAVAAMLLFTLVNAIGIRAFTRINNVLVSWKLVIISIVVVAFLFTTFHAGNFHTYGVAPSGLKGTVSAISTAGIVFSFLGFRQAVELGGESDNPHRNIPLAVIGSVLLTAVIYVLLQVAFIASVPPSSLSKSGSWAHLSFTNDAGPLAAIASLIGLGWLATVLYIDAVVSPADTGLIYTTVTARISYAMARNGNAPRQLGATSARGVPMASVVLAFLVGLIVFLPFPGWQKLVGFITSATVLSFGSGPLVLAALRRSLPDQPRPFRVPGGDVLPFLAFWAANQIVFWAGWDVNWKLFLAVLLGFVLLGVQELRQNGASRIPLNLRCGWWIAPWFGLLALVSYLGTFSSDGTAHGQAGVIPFGWDFVVLLAVSALIYVLAVRSRFTPAQVRSALADPSDKVRER